MFLVENKELSMTWHYIFSIYQIAANVGSLIFALFCFFDLPDILYPIIGVSFYSLFCFITGIMMLCREKLAYLFCQIMNWFDVFLGILYVAAAFVCWFYFIPNSTIKLPVDGLLIFVGFLLLVLGVSISIVHGASIKYFKKRKDFYSK